MITDPKNDERFDIDPSSIGAAKQMKELDQLFLQRRNLGGGIFTIPVSDKLERLKFSIGAYNAGQGRIAKAQRLAQADGKDPTKWDDVKNYLIAAGADEAKAKEIIEYVENVLGYEKEFKKKSKARNLKDKNLSLNAINTDGHWVTLDDGRHVLIADKVAVKRK